MGSIAAVSVLPHHRRDLRTAVVFVRIDRIRAWRPAGNGRVGRHRQDAQGQEDDAQKSLHSVDRQQESRPSGEAGKVRQTIGPVANCCNANTDVRLSNAAELLFGVKQRTFLPLQHGR